MMQNQTKQNDKYLTSDESWYEIRVGASLEAETIDWLGDFAKVETENGLTVLVAKIPDQPALFGLLLRVRDLGLPLVSVNLIQAVK